MIFINIYTLIGNISSPIALISLVAFFFFRYYRGKSKDFTQQLSSVQENERARLLSQVVEKYPDLNLHEVDENKRYKIAMQRLKDKSKSQLRFMLFMAFIALLAVITSLLFHTSFNEQDKGNYVEETIDKAHEYLSSGVTEYSFYLSDNNNKKKIVQAKEKTSRSIAKLESIIDSECSESEKIYKNLLLAMGYRVLATLPQYDKDKVRYSNKIIHYGNIALDAINQIQFIDDKKKRQELLECTREEKYNECIQANLLTAYAVLTMLESDTSKYKEKITKSFSQIPHEYIVEEDFVLIQEINYLDSLGLINL